MYVKKRKPYHCKFKTTCPDAKRHKFEKEVD